MRLQWSRVSSARLARARAATLVDFAALTFVDIIVYPTRARIFLNRFQALAQKPRFNIIPCAPRRLSVMRDIANSAAVCMLRRVAMCEACTYS
jgi:hypothetical protein